jgi:hypothetical protein
MTLLPAPLKDAPDPLTAIWDRAGDLAVESPSLSGIYDPAARRFRSSATPVDSLSADGSVITYSTDTTVHVRAGGRDTVLFSADHANALVWALRDAGGRHGLEDLQGWDDPSMVSDSANWALSQPALTPDGKTVYFLCNGGTGSGAQGNTTFCFLKCDIATGRLTLLDTLGTFFGRPPDVFQLSPDGTRLLIASSVHNSAADNSEVVDILDIATGRRLDLLAPDKPGSKANVVEGACWSPDGRYAAVSVFYYDPSTYDDGRSFVPLPNLEVKDSETGHTVRVVKDFIWPSWGGPGR